MAALPPRPLSLIIARPKPVASFLLNCLSFGMGPVVVRPRWFNNVTCGNNCVHSAKPPAGIKRHPRNNVTCGINYVPFCEAVWLNRPPSLHQSHLLESTSISQQSRLCESTTFSSKATKRTRGLESRSDSPWLGQGPQRRDPASERYNRLTRIARVTQQSRLS